MWQVEIKKHVRKKVARLPAKVQTQFYLLVSAIKRIGPAQPGWPNYSKLEKNKYHCHLKKGHPTYVTTWIEIEGEIKLVEIEYVGTHENAPY